MDYSAGNLELQLTAISNKAITSLNNVSKALSSLSSSLTKITSTDMKGLTSLSTRLSTLAQKMSAIDWTTQTSGIQSFASALAPLTQALNSISLDNLKAITSLGTRFSTFGKKLMAIDWTTVESGFKKLTTAITPFIDKISTAENSLKALNEMLTKISGKKLGSLDKISKGGLGGFNFKRLFNVGVALRFGRAVERIVQYGVNFTETLNLWQVAMRENLDQADEFIKKMNRAYGISQTTLMNAQATFKNMIGSLGNISDAVAYQLSESILQMAMDFSSLYNVPFENAITKFQAALAGQVRPIRSGSGYDITENTLFQLYQELGGTKTQRQLNRTEKQLLAIYAVFQQMQRSGAVGDLAKTLDVSFANQSRMISENFKELATYAGLFAQDLLMSAGVMKYINAGLIFLTEVMKALTNYKAPNFLDGMFESVASTNDEVDELQGKLLDFDKFRALDSSIGAAGGLAIDEKLVKALSDYQSILSGVTNEARELATKWLRDIGLLTPDINGELVINKDRLNQIKSSLISIVEIIGVIIGIGIVARIIKVIKALNGGTAIATKSTLVLIGGISLVIYALNDLIRNWDNMSTSAKVTKIAILGIGVALTTFAILSKIATYSATGFLTKLKLLTIGLAVGGIGLLIANISLLAGSWDKMTGGERAIGIFGAIGAAALAAGAAIAAFHGAWTIGTAAMAIIGGLAAIAAAFVSYKASMRDLNEVDIPNYAMGASDIDSGTVFRAGEFGRTEAVYTGANGKTNVANVFQMEQAFYNALVRYARENRGTNTPITVNIDGKPVFNSVRGVANSMGLDFARKSY